ncbi:MAG: methyl-accepting chemotaxis protein [Bryobacterales bacterium]|nr:methyl-accepting chemotaxis protein [Bryobacterales bacterium]
MRAVSEAVKNNAERILRTARDLSGLATGTTGDIKAVAAASVRTTASVVSASEAADALAGAFQKIQLEAKESAGAASRAASGTDQIQAVIAELNETSQRIGGVVRLISQIARQTNLLALNAAIEAARSGEAGRGFAVVASEVKNLAQKTASATSEIESEIRSIQQAANLAANSIATISGTIHSVNDVAHTIALAVSSQQEATGEIHRSVREAAGSTQAMAERIEGVTQAASNTSESAEGLLEPADQLLDQAAAMRTAIDEFLTTIRA